MALLAALPAIASGATAIQNLFHGKDGERQAATDAAYERAVNGDANALAFLRQRTGLYGTEVVPGYENNTPVGGWATAAMRDYARQKYEAAKQVLGIGGQVDTAVDALSQKAAAALDERGYQVFPKWAVWAGAAVLGAAVLWAMLRSRR